MDREPNKSELRAKLFEHCLRLDMSFQKTRTPGEMIQRIDGDVDALSNFFSQLVVYVLSNLVLLVGVLALLFFEDWRVGLALTVFAVIALTVMTKLRAMVPHCRRSARLGRSFTAWARARHRDIRFGRVRHAMMRFTSTGYLLRTGARPRPRARWAVDGLLAIANAPRSRPPALPPREMGIGTARPLTTRSRRRPIEQISSSRAEPRPPPSAAEELFARSWRSGRFPARPRRPGRLSRHRPALSAEAEEPVRRGQLRLGPAACWGLGARAAAKQRSRAWSSASRPDAPVTLRRRGPPRCWTNCAAAQAGDAGRRFQRLIRDNCLLRHVDPDERLLAGSRTSAWALVRSQAQGLDTEIASGGFGGAAQLLACLFPRRPARDPDEAWSRSIPRSSG
jgi:hypothetical protein